MERFTFFTDDYPAVTCDSCYEDQNENYTGPAIDRLAEYEATGLMPAEVAALTQELKYAKQQCREERRWIPVTERLPEESGMYIVTANDGHAQRVSFVLWQKKNRTWNLVGARSYWMVTHWMPLPEPPEKETP